MSKLVVPSWVGQYTHQKLVSGKADVRQIDVQQSREAEPIWQLMVRLTPAAQGLVVYVEVTPGAGTN